MKIKRKNQKIILVTYFCFSIIILLLGLLTFWPAFKQIALTTIFSRAEYEPYELFVRYYMLPSIWVVTFAYVPYKRLIKNQDMKTVIFIVATLLGSLASLALLLNNLGYVDCGHSCVGAVYYPESINRAALPLAVCSIGLPVLLLIIYGIILYRNDQKRPL